jgi:hypothetical protein
VVEEEYDMVEVAKAAILTREKVMSLLLVYRVKQRREERATVIWRSLDLECLLRGLAMEQGQNRASKVITCAGNASPLWKWRESTWNRLGVLSVMAKVEVRRLMLVE